MVRHEVVTTDAEIEAALGRAESLADEPVALGVSFVPQWNLLVIALSDGHRLAVPVEDLQGLEQATPEQMAVPEILGHGTGIRFPLLDADFYLPALIQGVYGTRRWMAVLGRRGGGVRSVAKRQAARENGARGGRPKKAAAGGAGTRG